MVINYHRLLIIYCAHRRRYTIWVSFSEGMLLNYNQYLIFILLLDLSRNRLAKISNMAFDSLSNLTYLDVSYNKLTIIVDECLYPLTKLQYLNISGNNQMMLMEMKSVLQVRIHPQIRRYDGISTLKYFHYRNCLV